MKQFLLLAITSCFFLPTVSEAGPMGYPKFGYNGNQSERRYSPSTTHYYSPYRQYEDIRRYNAGPCGPCFSEKNYDARKPHNHCATRVYVVSRKEISRCQKPREYIDNCGRKVSTSVTLVTYCETYSDGSTRKQTKLVANNYK